MYIDPILTEIAELIKASNKDIKEYYFGDPLIIPRSNLPSLILSKATTVVEDHTNAEDSHRMNIVLTLVSDIRQDFNNLANGEVAGWNTLYDIMEGRNMDYTLKPTSLPQILKSNANLSHNAQIDVDNPIRIDYGLTIGKRGERAIAVEANLFLTVFFDQLRDSVE